MLDAIWNYPYKIYPFISNLIDTYLRLRPFTYILTLLIIFPLIGTQVFSALLQTEVKYSNKLKVGFIGSTSSINPYPAVPIVDPLSTSSRILNKLLFDRLVDFDEKGNSVNNLITGYSSAEEFKVFTFDLKKDIKWSDGVNFDAEDVVRSFELIRSEPQGLYFTSLNDVETTKISDYQVQFRLKKGNFFFPDTLIWPIVPAHIFNSNENYTKQLDKNTFRLFPVTTTQWIISDRSSNSIELTKNKFYNRSNSNLSQISFKGYEKKTEIEQAIKSRDIDLYFSAEQQNDIDGTSIKPISIIRQYYALFFNLDGNAPAWTRDQNIRKALAYGIKKDDILQNKERKQDGPLPPESSYYNKDIEKYDFSPQKASELLDRAGYKLVNNVRIGKDGQPLKITLTVQGNTPRLLTAKQVILYWSELGIQANLEEISETSVTGGELLRNRFATNVILPKKFEVVLYGIETPPGWDRFSLWHSIDTNNANETFSNNIGSYSNITVDRNLERARLDDDQSKRNGDFTRFQKLLTDDVPAIFLYSPNIYVTYSKMIENIQVEKINSPEDLIGYMYNIKIRI